MSDDVVGKGKYVSLTYTILDQCGDVVELHDIPIGYVYGGDSQLIGDMDKAISGHKSGDEVQLTLSPDQAFGEHKANLTFTDDLENVPQEFRHLGAEVTMENDRGESRTFYVTRIADGKLTVDGNHPLAGQHLEVSVKIIEVRDPKPGEDQVSGIHTASMTGPSTIN